MNIKLIDPEKFEFEISYFVSGFIHRETVNERTAQLLQRAKDAGKEEKAEEIRKALGLK